MQQKAQPEMPKSTLVAQQQKNNGETALDLSTHYVKMQFSSISKKQSVFVLPGGCGVKNIR